MYIDTDKSNLDTEKFVLSPRGSHHSPADDDILSPTQSPPSTTNGRLNFLPRLADEYSVTMEQIFDALGSQQQMKELLERHIGKDKASFVDDQPLGGERADAIRYNVENMYEFEEKDIAAMGSHRLRTRSLPPRIHPSVDLMSLYSPTARSVAGGSTNADAHFPYAHDHSRGTSFSSISGPDPVGMEEDERTPQNEITPRADHDDALQDVSTSEGETPPCPSTPVKVTRAPEKVTRAPDVDATTKPNKLSPRGDRSRSRSGPRRGEKKRAQSMWIPKFHKTRSDDKARIPKPVLLHHASVLDKMSYAEVVRLGMLGKSAKKNGISSAPLQNRRASGDSGQRPASVPSLDLAATKASTPASIRRPIDVSLPSSRRDSARGRRQSPSRVANSSEPEGWCQVRGSYHSHTERGSDTPPGAAAARPVEDHMKKHGTQRLTSNGFDILTHGEAKPHRPKPVKVTRPAANTESIVQSPSSISKDQEEIASVKSLKAPESKNQKRKKSDVISVMSESETRISVSTRENGTPITRSQQNSGRLSVVQAATPRTNSSVTPRSSQSATGGATASRRQSTKKAGKGEQTKTNHGEVATPLRTGKRPSRTVIRTEKGAGDAALIRQRYTGIRSVDSYIVDLQHSITAYTTPGKSHKNVSKTPILTAGGVLLVMLLFFSHVVVSAILS